MVFFARVLLLARFGGSAFFGDRQPDVAYCVHGLVRGFTSIDYQQSLKTMVINAVGGGRRDVYFFLKLRPGARITSPEFASLNATLDQFVPKPARVVFQYEDLDKERRAQQLEGLDMTTCSLPISNWHFYITIAYQWLDMRDCYREIQEVEKERGRKYDLVAKLRPDIEFCQPWPRYDTFNWTHYAQENMIATPARLGRKGKPMIEDYAALMLRAQAHIYFNAYKQLRACTPHEQFWRHCMGYMGNECYLSTYLAINNISFDHGRKPGFGHLDCCLWRNPEYATVTGTSHNIHCSCQQPRVGNSVTVNTHLGR